MAATDVAATRTRVAMVAPQRLIVTRGLVDVRAEPRDDSELVDQMHYGEGGAILARRSGWAFIQSEDHYFGWIPESAAAAAASRGGFRIVALPLAEVHERPDAGSPVVDRVPAGTWLALHPRLDDRGWIWAPPGWLALDATVLYDELPHRPPTAADLIVTAEAFLGVPYLWGGTTALGIDCSGFVQQVYRLNGIRLDRDAHQQAMEGRAVDVPAAGDLIFFGKDAVTHVALATGERTFIHAPQRGSQVEHAKLPAEGRNVRAIRRYLP
ncbi:MAG TPA: C40 family peptidase [Candidatus Limnocylindria bacterium]